jgi:hypothetical protein
MNFNDILKRAGKFTADNSPAILTAIAVTGTLTTALLTGRATLKAADILRDESQALEPKEKVALVWKFYVPATASACATIVCIILANRIGTRRAAGLAAVYAISEKAFDEYKHKVAEKFGESQERELRDEIAQDQVTRTSNLSEMVIIGGGSVLCYDAFTGRYFLSDMEALRKAQNDLNHKVLNDYYASLTDFYDLIGLPRTSYSDEVGWNSDSQLELQFSTVLSEDGRPCLSVDFKEGMTPIRDYYRVS